MTTLPAVRTALVAGATGAVGAALLTQLLADARYGTIKVLSRRPLESTQPKLELLMWPEGELSALGAALAADDVFCCLGTTLKKAGSRAGLESVDYHLVLDLARAALAQGAKQFLLVSSLHASLKSSSFYLRVKGRTEEAVTALDYRSVHILRPSLLIAEREESRPAERLAQKLAPVLLDPLLHGTLAKFRSVKVEVVAAAMVTLALRNIGGAHIHHLPLSD